MAKRGPKPRPTDERFWAKVDRRGPDDCWPWTHAVLKTGYAQIRDGAGKGFYAHRFAYVLLVGPIPAGLKLDHLCHNADPDCPGGRTCRHRRCVNPAHLRPDTNRANILHGKSPSADHARATHCPQGHPYTPENTYRRPSKPERQCRICMRAQKRKWGRTRPSRAKPRPPQTHCKRGHEFTPENTYRHNGSRFCRACAKERQRAFHERRRAKEARP